MAGNNEVVEEVDEKVALRMLYDGAIYPHARDTYRVSALLSSVLAPCSIYVFLIFSGTGT